MVKKEAWRYFIVVFALIVLLVSCLLIYIYTQANYGNIIDLSLEDGTPRAVEFERLHMLPGEESSYVLRLNMKEPGKYNIDFDFEKIRNNGLEKFVHVKILVGGRRLLDVLLEELISEEAETVTYAMYSTVPEPIDIIYYIPDSVGNEAMGTWTTFELLLTASLED